MRFTVNHCLAVILLCFPMVWLAAPAGAQGFQYAGQGRLFSNDFLGDGKDRWRTGSYVHSFVWDRAGPQTRGRMSADALELRLRSTLFTPANLVRPARGDRPYAGLLSLGVHSHFREAAAEWRVGLDLVVTGPQTRLDQLQTTAHRALGMTVPSRRVLDAQISNAVYLAASGDLAWTIGLSETMRLRPFTEWEVGPEWLVRAGADLLIGGDRGQGLLLRDPSVGQLYSVASRAQGLSLLVGADSSYVARSVLLRDGQLRHRRHRARLGLSWQGAGMDVFYGLSWLSPEFVGQPRGQIVGSIRLGRAF